MGIYFRTPEQESPSFKRPHLIASLNYRRVRSPDILWQKHLFARFSLYFSYLTLSWSLLSRDKVCLVHNTIQDLQHSTFTLITHCTGLPCSNPIPSPTTSHATVARVDLKNTQLNACLPSLPSHCRSIVRSLVGTNLTTRAFVLGALLFSIYRQSLSFRTPSILFSLTAWHLKKKNPTLNDGRCHTKVCSMFSAFNVHTSVWVIKRKDSKPVLRMKHFDVLKETQNSLTHRTLA